MIVFSKDGRIEAQGLFENLVKSNQYIKSIYCLPSPDDNEIMEEGREIESEIEKAQQIRKEIGEKAKNDIVPKVHRGDEDISIYTYLINSFGWWAFVLTLVLAKLYVSRISFPRAYIQKHAIEMLLLKIIAEVMLSRWCGLAPRKN